MALHGHTPAQKKVIRAKRKKMVKKVALSKPKIQNKVIKSKRMKK